jgi:hypothetical protein
MQVFEKCSALRRIFFALISDDEVGKGMEESRFVLLLRGHDAA